MNYPRFFRNQLALFVSAATTLSAMAQDQPGTLSLAFEEVVVTAQRREQSLQDVPVAVSAIGGDTLRDAGVTDLLNLQLLVPSLTMEQNKGPGFATFRIRGIGNLGNIPNFEPSTGLFIDGAYRSKSGIGVGELVDVERIEVLRGPQSTLYGRNVTAGLISVFTRRPTEEFEGFVEASAGDNEEMLLKSSVSGSLSDNAQGRLSGMWNERDGTFDDINQASEPNEKSSYAVRGQLAFQPSDRLSVLAIAGYSEKDTDCCSPDVDLGALGFGLSSAIMGSAADNNPTNRTMQNSQTNTYEDEAKEFTLTIDYDFDGAVLTSLTSYDDYDLYSVIDAEQTPLDVLVFNDRQEADTFSQELRLTSTEGIEFDWMLGAGYYKNDFVQGTLNSGEPTTEVGVHIVLPPFQVGLGGLPGDVSYFKSSYDTENYSVFAQGNWHLTENITLGGGIRWFYEEKELDIRSTTDLGVFPSFALITTVPVPVSGDRDTDQFVWNLSVQYSAADDTMLYASVSRGAKGGGYNGSWDASGALSLEQREFDDEEVMSYELGIKTALLDQRVTVNANIFYSEFDDFQNASFLGLSFLVRNAEEVVTQGLEVDTVARLTEWLTVDFSYTYLDAEYEEFTQGACSFGRTPDDPLANTCDLSGETLPLAPENRFHLGLLGHWELAGGELYSRADYSWTDDTDTDNALEPRGVQESYGILNGRIGWRNESFELAAWVTNATDEDVVTISAPQTLFGSVDGGRQLFLNDPRTYGVTVRYTF